ncbi:MAG: Na+/H+ antiporter subunit E [Gemmatimonadota bacterium]
MPARATRAASQALAVGARLVVLVALWWLISDGRDGSWWLGGVAAVLGAWLAPHGSGPSFHWWRADRLVVFAAFYLLQAVRGGVDVALRALDPRRSVDPGFVAFALRLPDGPARSLLAVTISMLPGTVAAELRGDMLIVQRIHSGVAVEGPCRRAESLIAGLFGLRLERSPAPVTEEAHRD